MNRSTKIFFIYLIICLVSNILVREVVGYSTYGKPVGFGNDSTTTCNVGGDFGAINCTGNITAITGGYFLGDGSKLTGVITSGAESRFDNTSEYLFPDVDFPQDINMTNHSIIEISNISADQYLNWSGDLDWIVPAYIFDVDDEDIETDLNTYVDIAGDIMTGMLGTIGIKIAHTASNLTLYQGSADANPANIIFKKSRGTVASPAEVNIGDIVGNISWFGYSGDSTDYLLGAMLYATVAKTPVAANDMPMNVTLAVSQDGSDNPTKLWVSDWLGNFTVFEDVIAKTLYGNLDLVSYGQVNSDWDIGAVEMRAETFESDVATGTAPFVVASKTQVRNLNVSYAGLANDSRNLIPTANVDVGEFNFTAKGFGLNSNNEKFWLTSNSYMTYNGSGFLIYVK